MKKQTAFLSHLVFLACLCMSSCSQYHSSEKSTFTVSESEHEFAILTDYPEANTGKVERYMNEKIGDKNDISFTNTRIDAELTLDNGTKIYVVNKPGTLNIKLNKDENSTASYKEIKALSEGLKAYLNESN